MLARGRRQEIGKHSILEAFFEESSIKSSESVSAQALSGKCGPAAAPRGISRFFLLNSNSITVVEPLILILISTYPADSTN